MNLEGLVRAVAAHDAEESGFTEKQFESWLAACWRRGPSRKCIEDSIDINSPEAIARIVEWARTHA